MITDIITLHIDEGAGEDWPHLQTSLPPHLPSSISPSKPHSPPPLNARPGVVPPSIPRRPSSRCFSLFPNLFILFFLLLLLPSSCFFLLFHLVLILPF
ncbi:hypothetical protein BO82DRAFT_139516 [Aspergillus uvarum CBS 121591]|uniref:Uncharacterized protein n=1 Tax=Aspergillus uvarum CBS 121591 TaxID=1448315 RepID=A0A319DI13_9EURO|nr:hypothetical protein BO82DRAFT_139516 [Aspergillus uvarum CBS 121591]PYH79172.1 hypothetical protein BO82DRAFT_139516 [Aspergillus uvarum CBS 121591]